MIRYITILISVILVLAVIFRGNGGKTAPIEHKCSFKASLDQLNMYHPEDASNAFTKCLVRVHENTGLITVTTSELHSTYYKESCGRNQAGNYCTYLEKGVDPAYSDILEVQYSSNCTYYNMRVFSPLGGVFEFKKANKSIFEE